MKKAPGRNLGVEPVAEDYKCKCGTIFPASLGKYGCPNCEGDNVAKPTKASTDGRPIG